MLYCEEDGFSLMTSIIKSPKYLIYAELSVNTSFDSSLCESYSIAAFGANYSFYLAGSVNVTIRAYSFTKFEFN